MPRNCQYNTATSGLDRDRVGDVVADLVHVMAGDGDARLAPLHEPGAGVRDRDGLAVLGDGERPDVVERRAESVVGADRREVELADAAVAARVEVERDVSTTSIEPSALTVASVVVALWASPHGNACAGDASMATMATAIARAASSATDQASFS